MALRTAVLACSLAVLVVCLPCAAADLSTAPPAAQCSAVTDDRRIDCYPEFGANQEGCESRGCCWGIPALVAEDVTSPDELGMGTPWCFFPDEYGYAMGTVVTRNNGFSSTLTKSAPKSVYGGDIETLSLNVTFETDTRVHIKITDASAQRYEVPIPMPIVPGEPAASGRLYDVEYTSSPFGLAVVRVADKQVVWNSTLGGFIFSDQFIQFSSLLTSKYIYGLGEHVAPFLLDVDWSMIPLWAHDSATPTGTEFNLYGVHPFYMNLEDGGNAHGVFFLNSNAMDVILQPTPAITYRTIGGIIDLYILLGPTPNDVVQQYHDVIGHAVMPPYWALGFHLCRWGYGSLNQTAKINEEVRSYGIPQDVQWNDIDSMDKHLDFTYDPVAYKGLPEFVSELRSKHNQRWIVITDPGVSNEQPAGTYPPYDDGAGLWINATDNLEPFVGNVWPGNCTFPDFWNPKACDYWENQLKKFQTETGLSGLWIDMNEVDIIGFVDCPDNNYNKPPYMPHVVGGSLYFSTVCPSANQKLSKHYNLHSTYGYSETVATMDALENILGERTLVLSRSTYAGSGHHGAHWLGDNTSLWPDMYLSIPGMLNFNMFGVTLVGADTCGFNGVTTEKLCNRWMQVGAFSPFFRNHNSIHMPRQDPAAFGPAFAARARDVMLTRYTLLPYLYSLFHQAHALGGTVMRPLMFEFHTDPETYAIDKQFMWGSGLLITPVLVEDAVTVTGYFPAGVWYDYYTGGVQEGTSPTMGANVTLSAPNDTIPLHVHGGNILPTQQPAMTTTDARENPSALIVALDQNGAAGGFIFTDDGVSLNTLEKGEFLFVQLNATTVGTKGQLVVTPAHRGYTPPAAAAVSTVTVMGVKTKPTAVTAEGGTKVNFQYDSTHQVLSLNGFSFPYDSFPTITWSM